jgi:hypothetical protein
MQCNEVEGWIDEPPIEAVGVVNEVWRRREVVCMQCNEVEGGR